MRDFCDGDLFSAGQHPLLSVHEKAIQLILYNDDFEVANPLGSKATVHKIGMLVYYISHLLIFIASTVAVGLEPNSKTCTYT